MNVMRLFLVILYLISSSFAFHFAKNEGDLIMVIAIIMICIIGGFVFWVLFKKRDASESVVMLIPGDNDSDFI